MTEPLLAAFGRQLAELRPDWRELRFLVAYSGGLDSTALLHLTALHLPPAQLAAAHLNHGLRGPAAAADQKFAAATCRSLGLTFFTENREVAALAAARRRGLEEAARWARYDFLARAARDFQADGVLTAHQADDQAETMLMRLLKGTGAGGLAGIPPRRPLGPAAETAGPAEAPPRRELEVLRPLLSFSRAELRAWLLERQHPWIEDLSNRDEHYLRNALRNNVIPILKRLNPRLAPALGRTAAILRGEEDFWRAHLGRLWEKTVLRETAGTISLSRPALENLSLAERRRLIYEALGRLWRARPEAGEPLSYRSVETVLDLLALPRHSGLDLPGGLRAAVSRDTLRLSPHSRAQAPGSDPAG